MQAIQNANTCRCGLQNGRFEELVRFETVIKTFNLCRLSLERDLALALLLLGIRFARRPGIDMNQVICGAFHFLAFSLPHKPQCRRPMKISHGSAHHFTRYQDPNYLTIASNTLYTSSPKTSIRRTTLKHVFACETCRRSPQICRRNG
jgi:hypothetical protein